MRTFRQRGRGRQNGPVTVRPVTIDDIPGVARLHVRSWQAGYRGIVADGLLDALSDDSWLERWRGNLADAAGDVRTLVSVDDGAVTGFASIGPVRDPDPPGPGWQEVYAVYVDPASWGRGVGARLVTAALDTVEDGVPGVSLWVFRDNARARAFYQRHGFEPDGLAQELTIEGEAVTEVRYRRLSPGSTTMAR